MMVMIGLQIWAILLIVWAAILCIWCIRLIKRNAQNWRRR